MSVTRKEIDLEKYSRRDMFEIFLKKTNPVISTMAIVDITGFKEKVSQKNLRFFASISYILCRVVNAIPQFKQRISEGILFEYERIDPGYTVLLESNDLSFCKTVYSENFIDFYQRFLQDTASVKKQKDTSDEDNNHLFYITSIPWFSFTSFTHPYDPVNGSIPIITLGKFYEENGRLKMPVGVQVHHAVMDGYHLGLFYNNLQMMLDKPDICQ